MSKIVQNWTVFKSSVNENKGLPKNMNVFSNQNLVKLLTIVNTRIFTSSYVHISNMQKTVT